MADLESYLREQAAQARVRDTREQTETDAATAQRLGAEAARLGKLAGNSEIRWFLESYMAPLVEAEREAALDIRRSAAERNDAAQRHDLALRFLHLLDTAAQQARQRAQEAFHSVPA